MDNRLGKGIAIGLSREIIRVKNSPELFELSV